MGKRSEQVDAYIADAAEFARPILEYLRDLVHATCPEVEEALKWRAPHFLYKGMFCHMAAFKAHCAFGFWKGSIVVGGEEAGESGMGQFGRITKLSDLPSKKVLVGYLKEAMRLNEEGVKSPARDRGKGKPKAEVVVPDDLSRALEGNARAQAAFEGFPPSHKREYIEWITSAKTQATRDRRLQTALEWMAEGKSRNWKYENC